MKQLYSNMIIAIALVASFAGNMTFTMQNITTTQRSLIQAVIAKDVPTIRQAINTHANLNETDILGFTPLHYAARSNNLMAVSLLLQAGAITDAVNENGDTPLHLAVQAECTDVIQLLLQHGANPNAVNDYDETPLSKARSTTVVDLLKKACTSNNSPQFISSCSNNPTSLKTDMQQVLPERAMTAPPAINRYQHSPIGYGHKVTAQRFIQDRPISDETKKRYRIYKKNKAFLSSPSPESGLSYEQVDEADLSNNQKIAEAQKLINQVIEYDKNIGTKLYQQLIKVDLHDTERIEGLIHSAKNLLF